MHISTLYRTFAPRAACRVSEKRGRWRDVSESESCSIVMMFVLPMKSGAFRKELWRIVVQNNASYSGSHSACAFCYESCTCHPACTLSCPDRLTLASLMAVYLLTVLGVGAQPVYSAWHGCVLLPATGSTANDTPRQPEELVLVCMSLFWQLVCFDEDPKHTRCRSADFEAFPLTAQKTRVMPKLANQMFRGRETPCE